VVIVSAGVVIDAGEAIQDPDANTLWQYTATKTIPSVKGTVVQVTAFDLPGNKCEREKVL
jgi:hypothetical protein